MPDLPHPLPPWPRRVFCNRTLNLRSIRAVGFDMDYTLIHYRTTEWEKCAYEFVRNRLLERGWPVGHLQFDPDLVTLGLILDLELGNVVKANRFGYVKRATHGTTPLSYERRSAYYSRIRVDLEEPRWEFMNTLFGISEACLYSQLVDLLDDGHVETPLGYADLYRLVRSSIDEAHMEGTLKAEIMNDPERFVDLDPELPLALLDLKHSDKKILLITNSEWEYTRSMMKYAVESFLPDGMTWEDLFDVVIVQARKPDFFTGRSPLFEIVDKEQGLLKPCTGRIERGGLYVGGHAGLIESDLELAGEEILFVGDHIFADVHVSKNLLRWRTALVVRSLEDEVLALEEFGESRQRLEELMQRKELLEHNYSQCRVASQRLEHGYGPRDEQSPQALRDAIRHIRSELGRVDKEIAPLAQASATLCSARWGPLMRTGNDKSHLARQVERYADVYTSRVSNLLLHTPFVYLRSPRGSLPHDR